MNEDRVKKYLSIIILIILVMFSIMLYIHFAAYLFSNTVGGSTPFSVPKGKVADFWVSFWGGLYSGLITSLLGGTVVGLVLWYFQMSREQREESRTSERELSTVEQKIKQILRNPLPITISHQASEWLPKNIINYFEEVSSLPIAYWSETIKKRNLKRIIELISTSQAIYYEYQVVANSLELRIKNELLKNYTPYSDGYNHGLTYCFGLINGAEFNKLRSWCRYPVEDQSSSYYQEYNRILEDEIIKNIAHNYMTLRKELGEIFIKFLQT